MRELLFCPILAVVVATNANYVEGQSSYFVPVNKDTGTASTCQGCFCVVKDGEECPAAMPYTQFDAEHIHRLQKAEWENPILLDCDPYQLDGNCTLLDSNGNTVEVKEQDNDVAVCGMLYNPDSIVDKEGGCFTSYSTKTFPSRQELDGAQEEGYFLTHYGACGACSSTQDLAVYMQLQFESVGIECGAIAITNETAALECFVKAGFTSGCAATWLYNTIHTRKKCLSTCLEYLGKPPNQDAPQCPYNDCLQCDEEHSGRIFRRMAGRSRRRSGLLSYIVQNCSRLFLGEDTVIPTDPCPAKSTPSANPSSSSGAVSYFPSRRSQSWQDWGVIVIMGSWMAFSNSLP